MTLFSVQRMWRCIDGYELCGRQEGMKVTMVYFKMLIGIHLDRLRKVQRASVVLVKICTRCLLSPS